MVKMQGGVFGSVAKSDAFVRGALMTNAVPPDLQVVGMTKRFGPLVALKDVNFQAAARPVSCAAR